MTGQETNSKPTVTQLAVIVASGLLLAGASCAMFFGYLAGFLGLALGLVIAGWGLWRLITRSGKQ